MPLAMQSELCTGCRLCMLACSAVKKGAFFPLSARLFVEQSYTGTGLKLKSRLCNLCLTCRDSCPAGAIVFNGNYLELKKELCNGCGTCVDVCPTGVLRLEEGQPALCDLCSGDPQCTRWCPTGALLEEGK